VASGCIEELKKDVHDIELAVAVLAAGRDPPVTPWGVKPQAA